jgi:hypothetical protein
MVMARRRVDLRLDEELLARLDARCEELGQTRTKFIERALEKALSAGERSESDRMPVVARPGSASPRAPHPDLLSQRQAELNKRKK